MLPHFAGDPPITRRHKENTTNSLNDDYEMPNQLTFYDKTEPVNPAKKRLMLSKAQINIHQITTHMQ